MIGPPNIPPVILGGDPFSHMFRLLYRQELFWRLQDQEYCLEVMKAAYVAGCRGFDASFPEVTALLERLIGQVMEPILGFGNPTWEQGVFLNGRYLQYSRDRIIATLVDHRLPRELAAKIRDDLCRNAVLVFGYDRQCRPLSDEEIDHIYLDAEAFSRRLSLFDNCHYIFVGGSDADWLIPLGRLDVVAEMARLVKVAGKQPILLCHYASYVLPKAVEAGLEVEGYALPLNREWSWFSREATLAAMKGLKKPIIAFMPLASGGLRQDIRGALEWLYTQAGVASILFGTGTSAHAAETTRQAIAAYSAAKVSEDKGYSYGLD